MAFVRWLNDLHTYLGLLTDKPLSVEYRY